MACILAPKIRQLPLVGSHLRGTTCPHRQTFVDLKSITEPGRSERRSISSNARASTGKKPRLTFDTATRTTTLTISRPPSSHHFSTSTHFSFHSSATYCAPSASTMSDAQITQLKESDYDQWATLFRAYIDFYKSTIPDAQYRKTFDRLVDPKGDIDALVLRDPEDETKLIGLAHFYTHQTPWSEGRIMHFNDLFIDPNTRSKGYGRKMILAVRDKAKEAGCFRLEWATQHGNPARKLYDQLATCDFVEYRIKIE